MRVAVNDAGNSTAVSASEAALAADMYRLTRLLPQEALGAVVHEMFTGMNGRYGSRLGVSGERLKQEHQGLVDAARLQVG